MAPPKTKKRANIKITPKRPGAVKSKSRAKAKRPWQLPPIPQGAAAVNIENRINLVPWRNNGDLERPWYFYDAVDPVAKFRHMGDRFDSAGNYVTEGEDDADLTDNPGEDTKPVYVYGYEYVTHSFIFSSHTHIVQAAIHRCS